MKYRNELSEYEIVRPTQDAVKKKEYWETAIGLNQVDHLEPSERLLETAKRNIEGELADGQVYETMTSYYSEKERAVSNSRTRECDLVSVRMKELLEQNQFTFSPEMLKGIHKYLFADVYPDIAGRFRECNIKKSEPILKGDTVTYSNYFMIEDLLRYDFQEESRKSYHLPIGEKELKSLVRFTSSIWQVHPFMEGNTRTTALFIELYLNSKGYEVNNKPFQAHAKYFRDALVRSNYTNVQYQLQPEFQYLEKFYENLLLGSQHELDSRELDCSGRMGS